MSLAMLDLGVCFDENQTAGGTGGDAGGSGGGTGATPKTYTEAEYNALVAERNTLRTEHDTVKSKLTTFEQAQLTDQQKTEAKATEAEQKRDAAEAKAKTAQERVVKAEFKVAAKDAGILDPDLALLAIKDKIEFDDAGEPKNVTALLEQLVKDKPYLVGTAPAAGIGLTPGAARNGRGGQETAEDKINSDFAKSRGNSSGFRLA